MTLEDLFSRMSSEELTYQMAYDRMLGEEQTLRDLDNRAQQNLQKRRG